MEDRLGDFLVSFRSGEIIGTYNHKEEELIDIGNRLACLDRKYFDPCRTYSKLARHKLLARVEIKNLDGTWLIFFFYPVGQNKDAIRSEIINAILKEARYDYKLCLTGHAVVVSQEGNFKLAYLAKSYKNTLMRKNKA